MEELKIAKNVYDLIVKEDQPFGDALKSVFLADPSIRPYRKIVSGLLGCELRHHLMFSYLTKNLNLTEDERAYAVLALADLYFYHRLNQEILIKELETLIGVEAFEALKPLIERAGKPEEYIPANVKVGSDRYLSLRYNTPEWVLKVWVHYGYGTTYKILRANVKPAVSTYRLCASMLNIDDVLSAKTFLPTNVEGIYTYVGNEPIRKLNEYKSGAIFDEKPALKVTLDKFKVSEPSEALLFTGNKDDSIIREFIESYGNSIGYNIGVYDVDDYLGVRRVLKARDLRNVNFFAADPLAMDAAISRPQDLVVVNPNSTNFDLIREEPDYLLHFKKDKMDEIFRKEKEMLEGCSKFVADEGTLLYIINTISRKEGHATIADFLQKHSEFKLVNEMQLFPQDDLGTSMYYAVLHKDSQVEKLTPPLGDLSAVNGEVSSIASCSEK